jgi:hypothetical protein
VPHPRILSSYTSLVHSHLLDFPNLITAKVQTKYNSLSSRNVARMVPKSLSNSVAYALSLTELYLQKRSTHTADKTMFRKYISSFSNNKVSSSPP